VASVRADVTLARSSESANTIGFRDRDSIAARSAVDGAPASRSTLSGKSSARGRWRPAFLLQAREAATRARLRAWMTVARRVFMPGAGAVMVALAALKVLVYVLVAPEPCGPDMICVTVSADGPRR
jgi:hypothetical protein